LASSAGLTALSVLGNIGGAEAQTGGRARNPDRAPGSERGRDGGPEPTPAAIAAALPLDTFGLEHIGTVVPDVTRAAKFYSRVFNPDVYKERAEPLRYYVTLDPGYIALGSRAGESQAFIDHDCALLKEYDRGAMARRLEAEGLPPGRFGIIPDPDGLGLQLLGVPGGLAASTVPAGRLVDGAPLVRPRGLAHVVRYVSDLERSLVFYRKFFGPEMRDDEGRAVFHAAHTRWIVQPAPAGEAPRIDRFAVNVARFDHEALARALEDLGARVVSSSPTELHFRGPDGLGVELLPVDPARIWGLG
jgi:catechol 2,3-dioxygenase-like lactoylglutathione lyase family enzyme